MTSWQISPQDVKKVLEGCAQEATELGDVLSEKNFTDLSNAIAGGSVALMGQVPAALSALMEDQGTYLDSIGKRIKAGIEGVTNATVAYYNAQYDMEGNLRSNADFGEAERIQKTMLTDYPPTTPEPSVTGPRGGGLRMEMI